MTASVKYAERYELSEQDVAVIHNWVNGDWSAWSDADLANNLALTYLKQRSPVHVGESFPFINMGQWRSDPDPDECVMAWAGAAGAPPPVFAVTVDGRQFGIPLAKTGRCHGVD